MADESEPDEPTCDCCGSENPVGGLTHVNPDSTSRELHPGGYDACELCFSTSFGTAFEYARYGPDVTVMRLVIQVANIIRRDIAAAAARPAGGE